MVTKILGLQVDFTRRKPFQTYSAVMSPSLDGLIKVHQYIATQPRSDWPDCQSCTQFRRLVIEASFVSSARPGVLRSAAAYGQMA